MADPWSFVQSNGLYGSCDFLAFGSVAVEVAATAVVAVVVVVAEMVPFVALEMN